MKTIYMHNVLGGISFVFFFLLRGNFSVGNVDIQKILFENYTHKNRFLFISTDTSANNSFHVCVIIIITKLGYQIPMVQVSILYVLHITKSVHIFYIFILQTNNVQNIISLSFCFMGDVNSTIDRILSSYYLVLNKCADYYRKSTRCHNIQFVVHHSRKKK